jgi:hypothetical protein
LKEGIDILKTAYFQIRTEPNRNNDDNWDKDKNRGEKTTNLSLKRDKKIIKKKVGKIVLDIIFTPLTIVIGIILLTMELSYCIVRDTFLLVKRKIKMEVI